MAVTSQDTIYREVVRYRHFWIEGLRIFLGGLLFYKGVYFVENIAVIYELIEQAMPLSAFIIAHYVVGAHLVGGFLMVIGLLTRWAALAQIPILFGALVFVHGQGILFGPATESEYALLVLVLLVVFFFYGSGKFSVDHHLMRREEEPARENITG